MCACTGGCLCACLCLARVAALAAGFLGAKSNALDPLAKAVRSYQGLGFRRFFFLGRRSPLGKGNRVNLHDGIRMMIG